MPWKQHASGWCSGGIKIGDPAPGAVPFFDGTEWQGKSLPEIIDETARPLKADRLHGDPGCGIVGWDDVAGEFTNVEIVGRKGVRVVQDDGCGGNRTVELDLPDTCGLVVRTTTGGLVLRDLAEGNGIAITHEDGCGGNPTISFVPEGTGCGLVGVTQAGAVVRRNVVAGRDVAVDQAVDCTGDIALKSAVPWGDWTVVRASNQLPSKALLHVLKFSEYPSGSGDPLVPNATPVDVTLNGTNGRVSVSSDASYCIFAHLRFKNQHTSPITVHIHPFAIEGGAPSPQSPGFESVLCAVGTTTIRLAWTVPVGSGASDYFGLAVESQHDGTLDIRLDKDSRVVIRRL